MCYDSTYMTYVVKFIDTESRMVFFQQLGGGVYGQFVFRGYRDGEDEKEVDDGDSFTT